MCALNEVHIHPVKTELNCKQSVVIIVDVSSSYCSEFDWFLIKTLVCPSCLSVHLQWQGETQEFCPNAKVVLVGCKLDMRTDVNTLRELSKQRLIPVTHEQVRPILPLTSM